MVHHRPYRMNREAMTSGCSHIHQKDGKAITTLTDLIQRSSARYQQHEVRMLRSRNPDLLSIDHVLVTIANSHRFELRRIGAGCGLAHTKSLKAQRTSGDLRQIPSFLFLV